MIWLRLRTTLHPDSPCPDRRVPACDQRAPAPRPFFAVLNPSWLVRGPARLVHDRSFSAPGLALLVRRDPDRRRAATRPVLAARGHPPPLRLLNSLPAKSATRRQTPAGLPLSSPS